MTADKFEPNLAHEKRVRDYLRSLDDVNRELIGKLLHDEWHEGHAKGWLEAKSVYGTRFKKIIEDWTFEAVPLGPISNKNRKRLLDAIEEALK